MRDARVGSRWDQTSALMALLANCHRSKGRAYKPEDFHPMAVDEEEDGDDLSNEKLDRAMDAWLQG